MKIGPSRTRNNIFRNASAAVFSIILFAMPAVLPAPTLLLGDVAPLNAPDGRLDAADLQILERMIFGDVPPSLLGDIAPLGNPDGRLTAADLAALQRAIFGGIDLGSISVDAPSPPTLDPPTTPTNSKNYIISGYADPEMRIAIYVNANPSTNTISSIDGRFSVTTALNEGLNVIQARARNRYIASTLSDPITIILDTTPPEPITDVYVFSSTLVAGHGNIGDHITITSSNGETIHTVVDESGNFYANFTEISKDAGLAVFARDEAGNKSETRHIRYATGHTAGQLEVDDTGGANYTIPIEAPPGTAGMEPSLSFTYNSRGGDGILGVGWSLGGLSAITRCPRTLAQDNATGGINYDSNDRFCLDGERLIAINGAYGASGTEYRTERESFTRIISHGRLGSGPAWFEVMTKSGQTMHYGGNADSRLEGFPPNAMIWMVESIYDRLDNYIKFEYMKDKGAYYPHKIHYTGNTRTGLIPVQTIEFGSSAEFVGRFGVATGQMPRI